MGFILSVDNVVDFLKQKNVCAADFQPTVPITNRESKNFNLVVQSKDYQSFLVKQNRVDSEGQTSGNLITEWILQELINKFADLAFIQPLISEVVLFDRSKSISVSVFYDQYISLDDYYEIHKSYHHQIAETVGAGLAKIHGATYQQPQYREFLGQYFQLDRANRPPDFIRSLNTLDPSIFGKTCPDGLDFYKLYQRFPSLNQAVLELYDHIQPSCLTHNDLTLDNFIIDTQLDLDSDLVQIKPEQLKIIDWEFIFWADPAEDLGMLISQYLAEWLNSFILDPNLDLTTSLSLATCPLGKIIPSLKAMLKGYLAYFPQVIEYRPDFIRRIVQFAGIGIIDRLSYHVEYHDDFDNQALCKLQVAKNLLCYPEKGIETIFGTTEANLISKSRTKTPI